MEGYTYMLYLPLTSLPTLEYTHGAVKAFALDRIVS